MYPNVLYYTKFPSLTQAKEGWVSQHVERGHNHDQANNLPSCVRPTRSQLLLSPVVVSQHPHNHECFHDDKHAGRECNQENKIFHMLLLYNRAMNLHTVLPYGVIGVEVLLAFSLIVWMRSESRGTPVGWGLIIKVLAAGALVALISAFVTIRYTLSDSSPLNLILNTGSASLIEELAKYMVGVFILINNQQVKRLSDVIVCMIIAGLGFSLVEDLLYIFGTDAIASYRLLSFYLHSGTSAIVGYSLGRFHFGLTGYRELARALGGAVALHATYNLATRLNNGSMAMYLTLAITLLISLQIFILFRKTIAEQTVIEIRNKPKPKPNVVLLNL